MSSVVALVLAAGAEELLFRAYLIRKLDEIVHNGPVAILISAFVFGVLHIFRGPEAFAGSLIMGLFFGIAIVRVRSVYPLICAHAIYNILLSFSL